MAKHKKAEKMSTVNVVEMPKDNSKRNFYILLGCLAVSLMLFAVSLFDANRASTMLTGLIVILFALAIIGKAYNGNIK